MHPSDIAIISGFHHNLIAQYGVDGKDALGWLSDASQHARFKVLSTLGDFTGKSVLDAGCGHADLLPYLSVPYSDIYYTGIEQMQALLEVAKKRYGHLPNTRFLQADFSEGELPVADYVVASGALSYVNSDRAYLFKTIAQLFAHSKLGFGFNLLRALKYPDDTIVCYDPALVLEFCKRLTNNLRFEEGYWEDDFTVMMYH